VTKFENTLYNLPIVAFIIQKSKRIFIPGFKGLPLYYVVRFFFQQINKVGLNERAAAISFNLIQALPAALLFLFSIIPYLPDSLNAKTQIFGLFKDLTPNTSTSTFIQNLIDQLFKKHVGVFSFGFLLLMFYSSNAMMGVIRTFDKSIAERKSFFLHKRWRAIKITVILIVLFLVSILMLIGQEELAGLLKGIFSMKRKAHIPWWNSTRWLIIIALIFFGISLVYKYAPSVHKRWDLISSGSILATTLTLATTAGFSYWVNNFASYNKVYGSIGTVLIIMLLIYFNSLILLIGFELNVSITYLQAQAREKALKEKN
jgi:membrane protein